MSEITVRGKDGSTWHYHALYGDQYSPEETGWVLVVEGVPEPIDPQALTAAEVLGDLRAMKAADPPPEEAVDALTGLMIDDLERRLADSRTAREAVEGIRERLLSLRAEVAALGVDESEAPRDAPSLVRYSGTPAQGRGALSDEESDD